MHTIARFVLFALALGLAGVGCRAQIRGTATVTAPELVLVEGDVWVVERYHEPVFYTEGYYWRWYGGVWFRSTVHTGNWVTVTVVPATVQRIPKPEVYANYTAPAGATKRTGPPDHAPAHGVRGTEPGHAEGGPPGHQAGGPPGHAGGGPGMKEDKGPPPGAGGPPMKEEKAKPAEKAGGPSKEAKPADKGPTAKEAKPADKGPAAKEAKPADKGPAKEEKPAAKGGGQEKKAGGEEKKAGGEEKKAGGEEKKAGDKPAAKGGEEKKGGKK